MREEVRNCATCDATTMHRRGVFARAWICERCAWKRVAEKRFAVDPATTMIHVFEFIWMRHPRAEQRFRTRVRSARLQHETDL
jgi:ribosomal protein L37AE/L43A